MLAGSFEAKFAHLVEHPKCFQRRVRVALCKEGLQLRDEG